MKVSSLLLALLAATCRETSAVLEPDGCDANGKSWTATANWANSGSNLEPVLDTFAEANAQCEANAACKGFSGKYADGGTGGGQSIPPPYACLLTYSAVLFL